MKKILSTIGAILLLWLALCAAEIIHHYIFGGATYSDYNIITNILNVLKIKW